jgi:ATP-dependent DNA ligase
MFKIKHQRTMECVVTGYRLHKAHDDAIGSLLLGLYSDDPPQWAQAMGGLLPVGATASFPMAMRRELLAEFAPLRTDDHPWQVALERPGNRWNPARDRPFVPVRTERVVEVAYDHMDGHFLRHPATFLRWRPDREPRSCTFEQLETAPAYDVASILA